MRTKLKANYCIDRIFKQIVQHALLFMVPLSHAFKNAKQNIQNYLRPENVL